MPCARSLATNIVFVLLTVCVLSSQALSAQPSAKIGDLEYLDSLFKQQDFKGVVNNLKQFPTEQMRPEHFRFLIYSYAEMDLDDAEKAAELAIKALPNEPDVYLMHASIMGSQYSKSTFNTLEYAKKTIESLNKAVKLAPHKMEYREALLTFHLNAPPEAGGNKDIALQQIKIMETIDRIRGRINLAWYYRVMENIPTSLQVLNDLVDEYPSNVNVLDALASHYVSQSEYEQAIDVYEKLTQVDLTQPFENKTNELESFDEYRYMQLNAHYQIARLALLGNIRYAQGIDNMKFYINALQNPDSISVLDTSGLPSIDWANLRLSQLLLANEQTQEAKTSFSLVKLDKNNSNMAKVYNNLKKQLP